jgi:hypothetical protein
MTAPCVSKPHRPARPKHERIGREYILDSLRIISGNKNGEKKTKKKKRERKKEKKKKKNEKKRNIPPSSYYQTS